MTSENRNDSGEPAAGLPDDNRFERRQGQGPGRPPSKKQRIVAWLEDRAWTRITESGAVLIRAAFPDCSEETIRTAVLEWAAKHVSTAAERRLDPLVEGVRQDTLDHLASSLTALLLEYERGDRPRQAEIRALVLRAKEHATLAAENRNTSDLKRAEKAEAVLWLRTWLENPPLFPAWARLRRQKLAEEEPGEDEEEGEYELEPDDLD